MFNHHIAGTDLGVQLIHPNPLNPRRYIVILASSSASALVHQELDLSVAGWYDFLVWDCGREQPTVATEIGYFGPSWDQFYRLPAGNVLRAIEFRSGGSAGAVVSEQPG